MVCLNYGKPAEGVKEAVLLGFQPILQSYPPCDNSTLLRRQKLVQFLYLLMLTKARDNAATISLLISLLSFFVSTQKLCGIK